MEKPGPLCNSCPLRDSPGPIWGQGSPHAKIGIWGQCPGPTEKEKGFPFAGSSGKILNRGMGEVGIFRDKDAFVSNVVKCFIEPGKPVPFGAVKCCRPLLEQEMGLLDSLRLKVTVGAEAFFALTGKELHLQHNRASAEKKPNYWLVGYPFRTSTLNKVPILPMEHPASIMRKGFLSIPFWQAHWRKAKRWFDGNGAVYEEKSIEHPTDAEVKDYVTLIILQKFFGVDIETPETVIEEEDLIARAATPIDVIGLSANIGECVQVQPHQFHLLDPLFAGDYGLTGGAYNWGFDGFHMRQNWDLSRVRWYDIMLAFNILYSDCQPKDLGMCLSVFTDIPYHKNLRKTQPGIYNTRDTYGAYWAMMESMEALANNGCSDVFWDHDMPCIPIVEDMKNIGVRCDVRYAKLAELTCYKKLAVYEKWWNEKLPLFNWASTKDLKALFGKMGMPVRTMKRKRQKTKEVYYSQTLDEDVLEEYRDEFGNQTAGLILEMRKLKKASEFTQLWSEHDGRSHANYKIHGQKMGRIQAEKPDLQNIPEEAAGIRPRRILLPDDDDSVLIHADFSQIELRLYAAQAQDWGFLNTFSKGEYVYGLIFEEVFNRAFFQDGLPRTKENRLPTITPKEILIVKSCPLGYIYGRGANSMVNLGVTKTQGQAIFDKLAREHHAISEFHRRLTFRAEKYGFLQNPFGRIRRYPNVRGQRNEILAFPGQNTGADVLRIRALIPLYKGLSAYGARGPVLTVHDSIYVSCPKKSVVECVPFIQSVMEEPIPQLDGLSIPVEIKIGPNWDEGVSYEKYCAENGL